MAREDKLPRMSSTSFERLVALVRRDLGADDVRIVEAQDVPEDEPPAGSRLECPLASGRRIIAVFENPPDDREARLRRLEMIVESFGEILARTPSSSRPEPAATLHTELETLARRAGAKDALVIDARSPIVWGASDEEMSGRAAYETDVIALPERAERDPSVPPVERSDSGEVTSLPIPNLEDRRSEAEAPQDMLSVRAISAVRALPALPSLHKGGHLHHSTLEEGFGYIARSFASIYVLIVVFEGSYDELRAERAIGHAMPAIERLVLALPPHDPQPLAGAMAIRRRRRR